MKKPLLLLLFTFFINTVLAQTITTANSNEIKRSYNFPAKSKRQLFNLSKKFIGYGWQTPKDVSTVTFDELISGIPPKYDYNNPIQLKDKVKGIINCHIISRFHSEFHSKMTTSIWFEYDVEFTLKNNTITIKISNINTDEFVTEEQKISELYKIQVLALKEELEKVPNKLNEFILKN
jgi:hypothetical protein